MDDLASLAFPKYKFCNQSQLSTFNAAINAPCGMSTLPNCRIFFLPSFCFSRSFGLRVRLDCAGFDGLGKGPTDRTRRDDGVMPLICPTSQMVSQDASGITPAGIGYFTLHGVVFDIFVVRSRKPQTGPNLIML